MPCARRWSAPRAKSPNCARPSPACAKAWNWRRSTRPTRSAANAACSPTKPPSCSRPSRPCATRSKPCAAIDMNAIDPPVEPAGTQEEGGRARPGEPSPPAPPRAAARSHAPHGELRHARPGLAGAGGNDHHRAECRARLAVPQRPRYQRTVFARRAGQHPARDPHPEYQRRGRLRLYGRRGIDHRTTPTPTTASTVRSTSRPASPRATSFACRSRRSRARSSASRRR
jgi:hypothetical protein